MPPRPPELMEELVEEILLRFPPDDPASLVRAALVCKLWCRLISSTAFRRRFRKFHHSRAPILGVIYTGNCKLRHDGGGGGGAPRPRVTNPSLEPVRVMPSPAAYFVPNTSLRTVQAANGQWVAIDARHGRVLLYRINPSSQGGHTHGFFVWDPVTHEQRDLPELPYSTWRDYYSAVLCRLCATATAGGRSCCDADHHRGPFLVVDMEIQPRVVRVSVYSTEAGAWSQLPDFERPIPRSLGCFPRAPIVLVGSALCVLLHVNDEVVKCDLATLQVSAIPLPSQIRRQKGRIMLIDDDGEIGFADKKNRTLNVILPDVPDVPVGRQQATTQGRETPAALRRPRSRPRQRRATTGPTHASLAQNG